MEQRRHRRGEGDGFVVVADGTRRWGRFGAAGVLARHVVGSEVSYFVARRSLYCHQGGTWAMPGGALDPGETPLEGALREFAEEIGIDLVEYEVAAVHEDDHGGWSYWTVVVDVPSPCDAPASFSWETDDARWVAADDLAGLELFGAFRQTLERLGIIPPV